MQRGQVVVSQIDATYVASCCDRPRSRCIGSAVDCGLGATSGQGSIPVDALGITAPQGGKAAVEELCFRCSCCDDRSVHVEPEPPCR